VVKSVSHLLTLVLTLFVLGGCSSTTQAPPSTDTSTRQSTPANPDNPEPNDAVKQLNSGKKVKVETSQGTIEVEPTVVAITDAQAPAGQSSSQVYYNDPWEDFNRSMFTFNHYLYSYVLIPASDGYHYLVPATVRDKIGNAFDNIREPLNLLNNLATGEFDEAGANLSRFLINSTVGLFGLFDPASHWFDIAPHKQTIADTLFHYEVGAGPYLVLPVLGPSDSRGAFSTVSEGFIHPVNQLIDTPQSYQIRAFDGFDDFSDQSETYQSLYNKANDPYLYFRNQYIQGQRRDEYFYYKEQQNEE